MRIRSINRAWNWVVLALFIVIGVFTIAEVRHVREYTFTVSATDNKCDVDAGELTCYYVVFGTEGEVFKNVDSVWFWKWDSASVQAKMQVGKTYTVRASGYRIPFFSMKPNIIEVEHQLQLGGTTSE
jgi:hypothetical protein